VLTAQAATEILTMQSVEHCKGTPQMIDEKSEFQWVNARSACSPDRVFQTLKAEVQRDVEERKAIPNDANAHRFYFEPLGDTFTAGLEGESTRTVTFSQDADKIVATNSSGIALFNATLTINNEGQCRLKYRDVEYTNWQLRKMALEELFFGPSTFRL
jgi:hypothetical protein